MKNLYLLLAGVVCFTVLGAGGYYFFSKGYVSGHAVFVENNSGILPDVPPAVSTSIPDTSETTGGMRRYQNPAFHFGLLFPDNLAATEYKERNGALTVTFQDASTNEGFEIYVTPFSGTQIDESRFKLDEPSGRYLDPQQVVIDGAQATLFTGYNPIMGDTREVWFIHGGYLYEVATFKSLDSWLGTIMRNFTFK